MRIVGIVGKIASGKDTLAQLIKEVSTRPILHLSYSVKIDQLLDFLHIPRRDRGIKQDLGIMLEDFFKKQHYTFTDALFGDIIGPEKFIVVVSGIRFPEQLQRWKELVPNFYSVYLDASDEVRWERNNYRLLKGNYPPISFKDFLEEHEAETERHIEKMKAMCAYVFNNEGTEANLIEEAGRIVDVLRFQ